VRREGGTLVIFQRAVSFGEDVVLGLAAVHLSFRN
jgi:hypothetical protein